MFYGDNLDVLSRHIQGESVDLVYLDPPFNSNANYNVLFASKDGSQSAAQIQAFEDTWRWDQDAARQYEASVEAGGAVADALQAFRQLLGTNDMLAYLTMMAPRLVELRRVLKSSGSLYLHCDPTASHYLKVLLDAVFGPQRFKNEIVWKRYGVHNDVGQGSTHFGRVHDIILLYTKSEDTTWNQVYVEHDPDYIEAAYRYTEEGTGRLYTTTPMTGPGGAENGNPVFEWNGHTRAWRYNRETIQLLHDQGRLHYSRTGYARQKKYLDESPGVPVQDLWTDIKGLSGSNAERLGYPTQKPVALLERIIQASSNYGDVVLDPFCGCGTTIDAAQKLGRRWIGIDVTHLAVGLIKSRLFDTHGEGIREQYEVIGEPTTVEGAEELADEDKFQFQAWALGLVGARTEDSARKGADRGIDGKLYFHEGKAAKTRAIIFSVKAGNLTVSQVRDLVGVVAREKAAIGVLLSLKEPTKAMIKEAADAGFYTSSWDGKKYPVIQLLTVASLLAGAGVDRPRVTGADMTYKKAPKHVREVAQQRDAFDPS